MEPPQAPVHAYPPSRSRPRRGARRWIGCSAAFPRTAMGHQAAATPGIWIEKPHLGVDGATLICCEPWWRELEDGGGRGNVLIQGETLAGQVQAVSTTRSSVFARLRPTAPSWTGTLVVIDLD